MNAVKAINKRNIKQRMAIPPHFFQWLGSFKLLIAETAPEILKKPVKRKNATTSNSPGGNFVAELRAVIT